MKCHLVNIWFLLPNGTNFAFCGFVNQVCFDPAKLFLAKFGFEMPTGTETKLR